MHCALRRRNTFFFRLVGPHKRLRAHIADALNRQALLCAVPFENDHVGMVARRRVAAGSALPAGRSFLRADRRLGNPTGKAVFFFPVRPLDHNGLGPMAAGKEGRKGGLRCGPFRRWGKRGRHSFLNCSTSSTKTVAPPTVISRGMAMLL